MVRRDVAIIADGSGSQRRAPAASGRATHASYAAL